MVRAAKSDDYQNYTDVLSKLIVSRVNEIIGLQVHFERKK
ncbi:hypothetical protein E6C60_0968 [Paenibacillus algicola]|uniref:Uncharacterized protein n=1 Tax=Paenibacillus algicola TaxID=2565926 RepID=A0A4P8XGT0_9BACL|nr:hypothetical protein E6C60_0968 [Paenibacillus algicola]